MSQVTTIGVLESDDGVAVDHAGRLPSFSLPSSEAGFWQDTERACSTFSSILGIRVTVLRHLGVTRTSTGSDRLMLLEAQEPWEGRRVPYAELGRTVSASLDGFLDRPADTPGALRVPWFRSGWYREAADWIRGVLVDSRSELLGVQQVRSWNLSTVLAADTSDGRRYFKAESPALPGEVGLTLALSRAFPTVLPRAMAWDAQRRWMILEDAGSRRLYDSSAVDDWARAGRVFAELQVESLGHRRRLASLGCPVRPAMSLADDVAAMVTDEEWLTVGEYGLDGTDLEAVRRLSESWIERMVDVDRLGLPLAVEHGDFHPGQVMIGDDGRSLQVLDWSDVSISIPFISLEMFLASVNEFLGVPASADPPVLASAFRNAYLDSWGRAIDPAVVDEARRLLRGALPALCGLPYWRLVPRMEQPWEMWNVLPHMMRGALADQST